MTPLEDVAIRPMTVADIDAVLYLERASDAAAHWSRAEYLRCVEGRGEAALWRSGLIAEQSQQVVGFAVVRMLTTPERAEAELESILVAPAVRGGGIGRLLMASLLALVRAEQAMHLDLEVRASNTAAFRLYQRAGLVEQGRRMGYYVHPEEDAVLMRILL